jgi:hypothetical protein
MDPIWPGASLGPHPTSAPVPRCADSPQAGSDSPRHRRKAGVLLGHFDSSLWTRRVSHVDALAISSLERPAPRLCLVR